ncbi:MAG: type II toxin-antitoxin system VapC family toxin [Chloroflexota bacterium]
MNVVDSCGWLEYFADGANASFFAPAILDEEHLIVPTICLYEVFKRMSAQRSKEAALDAASRLYRSRLVELSDEIALEAAQVALAFKLPMADSIIYATAQAHNATIWTQDEHFKGLPNVQYIAKP